MEIWKWREAYLEEVKVFKYLGFTFNRLRLIGKKIIKIM